MARVPEPGEGGLGGGGVLRRLRDVLQPAGGLLTDRLVVVAAGALRQRRRVRQPLHGRPPNARVGVLAGERSQQLGLVRAELPNGVDPDLGVGTLPGGASAEAVEEGHHVPSRGYSRSMLTGGRLG
jgi:hypothetical protein